MNNLQKFFRKDTLNGVILIAIAAIAMVLANMQSTKSVYHTFLEIPIEIKFDRLRINKSILLWVNEALMTIFFLLVGIEVKRELTDGILVDRRQAIFPVFAAIGGMLIPALIYLALNFNDPITRNGWAIPIATDIAFALGVLSLLGNRVPAALKIFMMALAIIDDLGAIITITLFYTSKLSILPLFTALLFIFLLFIMNLFNLRIISIYILVGAALWIAILKTGIHSTISGVIVGLFIPLGGKNSKSTTKKLEWLLHILTDFLILPLFVFVNAGISLNGITFAGLVSTLPLGIIIGLFMGKLLGISIFCWLALKLKLASLPQGIKYNQIMGSGMLCGIGFTMSIFISTLAFSVNTPELIVLAKLGILIGSLLSAVVGFFLLRIKLTKI